MEKNLSDSWRKDNKLLTDLSRDQQDLSVFLWPAHLTGLQKDINIVDFCSCLAALVRLHSPPSFRPYFLLSCLPACRPICLIQPTSSVATSYACSKDKGRDRGKSCANVRRLFFFTCFRPACKIHQISNKHWAKSASIFALSGSVVWSNSLPSAAWRLVWSGWCIRALSPAFAVKFNISPGRWQHFPQWPLFLQRDKGKRTEMTGTQYVRVLKHQFLHYITIK
jgi:hypothetical protein